MQCQLKKTNLYSCSILFGGCGVCHTYLQKTTTAGQVFTVSRLICYSKVMSTHNLIVDLREPTPKLEVEIIILNLAGKYMGLHVFPGTVNGTSSCTKLSDFYRF
jgi:hypothetical protein